VLVKGKPTGGSLMVSTYEKLQQLLDGELNMDELEKDPALASLANRLYGIKIATVTPQKTRDIPQESASFPQPTEPSDLYIETIAPAFPASPAPLPMNDLPPLPQTSTKKGNLLSKLFFLGFIISVSNILGFIGMLTNSPCNPNHYCPVDGYTRFNYLYIFDMNEGYAWSQPILDGSYGIPDLVAIFCSLIFYMWFRGKK
jgi:hypothetical protein